MSWWYKQRQAGDCFFFALCTEDIPRHSFFYSMEKKSTGLAYIILNWEKKKTTLFPVWSYSLTLFVFFLLSRSDTFGREKRNTEVDLGCGRMYVSRLKITPTTTTNSNRHQTNTLPLWCCPAAVTGKTAGEVAYVTCNNRYIAYVDVPVVASTYFMEKTLYDKNVWLCVFYPVLFLFEWNVLSFRQAVSSD